VGAEGDRLLPGIVLWPSVRDVLTSMRPVIWLVLEDVALDAYWRDGQLVAPTSARRVAEDLGIEPGTAASALRVLRDRDVVELSRAVGPDGRFGLASYVVHLPLGIELLMPSSVSPETSEPRVLAPHMVERHTVDRTVADRLAVSVRQELVRLRTSRATPTCGEQGELDLGGVEP